MIKIRFFF